MAIKTKIQLRRDTLTNWSSANPVLAQGEVALVDKNNVTPQTSATTQPLWVIRIGDGNTHFNDLPETAYLLRSELEDVSQGLTDLSNITGVIGGGGLSAAISSVSSAVSSLYLSSSTISSAIDTINSAIDNIYLSSTTISTEVHNKVKIEGTATDYVNISRVNAETYHSLINGGTIDPKTIYIVSSDNINAFGERVINVGDAVNLSDAVNLKQLSVVSADIISKSSGSISSVSAAVSSVSAAVSSISSAVSSLYLSSTAISNAITSLNNDVNNVRLSSTALSNAITSINDDINDIRLSSTAISNAITSLNDDVNNVRLSSTTISSAVDFLSSQISSIDDDYSVEVSSLGRTGDTYKYAIMQGGASKGEIEVPYDVFVDKGEIQTIDGKKYLLLTLNNEASTVLSIETTDLVDVYTGTNTDTISVNVDQYQIEAIVNLSSIDTAHIKDGAVTTAKIANDAVTTAKILDSNVTTAKIADDAVTTGKILDAAVTPAKLDPNGVFVFDCGNAAAGA